MKDNAVNSAMASSDQTQSSQLSSEFSNHTSKSQTPDPSAEIPDDQTFTEPDLKLLDFRKTFFRYLSTSFLYPVFLLLAIGNYNPLSAHPNGKQQYLTEPGHDADRIDSGFLIPLDQLSLTEELICADRLDILEVWNYLHRTSLDDFHQTTGLYPCISVDGQDLSLPGYPQNT